MKNLILGALCVSILFSACKKGDRGEAGINGTNGTNGVNGNTNVSGTILEADGPEWQWDDIGKRSFITLTDSAVTNSIYDSGSVEVFMQTGAAAWVALPYSFIPAGAPYTLNWYYMHSVGSVTVYVQASDGSQIPVSATTNYFKTVCISSKKNNTKPGQLQQAANAGQ